MKIITVNTNGLSSEKIEKLARYAQDTNVLGLFLQETKRTTYPLTMLAAFPKGKYLKLITPGDVKTNNQGMITIIRENPDVSVLLEDLSEKTGALLHSITLNNGTSCLKLANVYWAPSEKICKSEFDFLAEFDLCAGDLNLNCDTRKEEASAFCEEFNRINLVSWPTFQAHSAVARCTNLTDAILCKPSIALTAQDLGISIADHASLSCRLQHPIFENSENLVKNGNSHFHVDLSILNENLVNNAWINLPNRPSWQDIQFLKTYLLSICTVRNKVETKASVNLIFTPSPTNTDSDEANNINALSTFWSSACEDLNEMRNLGQVFNVIKVFREGSAIDTIKKVFYPRRDLQKSFRKYTNTVCRPERLSNENFNKYTRIMSKAGKSFKYNTFRPTFTCEEVKKEISASNAAAARGPDNFEVAFLPKNAAGLTKFTNFINDLFDQEKFVLCSEIKRGRLCFIPKSEGSGDVRPLVLSSRILSIIDRLVNQFFLKFINASKKLKNRFAYRPLLGCEDCLGSFFEFVGEAKKNKKVVAVGQLDLTAAFNGAGHKNTIIKVYELLHEIGLHSDPESLWVLIFLKSWFRREILFEKTSFTLLRGVPQGSPLSPSLFNIVFAWDYESGEWVRICFYADDNSILVSANDLETAKALLFDAIDNFLAWCLSNEFIVNFTKSKILVIGNNAVKKTLALPPKYEKFEQVSHLKILGVWVDSSFTFTKHLEKLEDYMRSRIIAVRQLRNLGLSDWNLRVTILALRTKLSYGLYQCLFMANSTFNKVDGLFTKLVKAWTGASRFVKKEILFEQAGISDFKSFVEYLLASRYILKGKSLSFFNEKNWCSEVDPSLITLPISPKELYTRERRTTTIEKTRISETLAYERNVEKEEKLNGPLEFIKNIEEWKLIEIDKVKSEVMDPTRVKSCLKKALKVESVKKTKQEILDREALFEKIKKESLENLGIEIVD